MMVVLGTDAHKRTHTIVAADEAGAELASMAVAANSSCPGVDLSPRRNWSVKTPISPGSKVGMLTPRSLGQHPYRSGPATTNGSGSTGAATDRPTLPSTGSPSPSSASTHQPNS